MTAQQAKQVVKNALYRTIGETSTAFRLGPESQRTLSVLMYHKVNDIPDNPTTVPVGRFDEQLAQLGELGYRSSTSTRCSTTTRSARRCRRRRS